MSGRGGQSRTCTVDGPHSGGVWIPGNVWSWRVFGLTESALQMVLATWRQRVRSQALLTVSSPVSWKLNSRFSCSVGGRTTRAKAFTHSAKEARAAHASRLPPPPSSGRRKHFWSQPACGNGALARKRSHPVTFGVLQIQNTADLGQRHQCDVFEWRRRSRLSHGTLERIDHLVALPCNLPRHEIKEQLGSFLNACEYSCT